MKEKKYFSILDADYICNKHLWIDTVMFIYLNKNDERI